MIPHPGVLFSSSPQDCDINEKVMALTFLCLYIMLFIPALLLNGAAAWVSLHIPAKSTFILYLKNLIATDLLTTLTIPLMASADLPGVPKELKAFACRYSDVLFYFSMYINILLMGLISLDRFFKIVQPFGRLLCQTLAFGATLSASMWILLFSGTVVPTVILTNQRPANASGNNCMALKSPAGVDVHEFIIFSNQIMFWAVCLLTVFCYACIAKKVLQSYRSSGSSNDEGRRKTRVRVFIVLVVFFVCFVPYHAVRVPYTQLQTNGGHVCKKASLRIAKKFFLWLSTSHVCLDPLIYIYLCRPFRERLREIWRPLLLHPQNNNATNDANIVLC
ncbi:P2Y purinoceptor 13-like [Megalops cyprinoides]|uniref:P2Y purinoceptor 13-like n=1 Tax=Megalops cyprinoides TaxID=118141 RepID=UPI0018652869|nr:P2Y purinoceptor 13-like [Megalops cyprinoides]